MRRLQTAPSQGALPPNPRDIYLQYEISPFHTGPNIPAGGSDASFLRNGAEPGAQNSSFKNFDGQRLRQ
jgi:hypothetical protein